VTAGVVIDSLLRIRGDADPELLRRVRVALERERPVRGAGGRVQGVEVVGLARREGGDLVVPRGALSLVREIASEVGIGLRFEPRVVGPGLRALPAMRLGVELRPYQERAVDEMIRRVQCLVNLPCGGGKTTIGAAAIVRLGLPALVIAPTVEILDQWAETLARMGADRVFRVGKRRPGAGDVALGTPGALRGPKAEVLRQVGVVVVDECHRALAPTWLDVLARCPARFRFGLTATIGRSDKMEWALPYVFGDVIVPATTEELIGAGWLVRPTVIPVASGWSPSDELRPRAARCPSCAEPSFRRLSELRAGATCRALVERAPNARRSRCGARIGLGDQTGEVGPLDWTGSLAELGESAERSATLIEVVVAAVEGGRRALALVPSVEMTRSVVDRLRARGVEAASLSGSESKGRRREVLDALRAGRVSAVVATKVADEGLDVPDLDCVVLASPGKAKGATLQRAGRSMRPGGLPPIVVDLVDGGPEMLRHFAIRLRAYRETYGSDAILTSRPVELTTALGLLRAG
jgi:superfamily II DNA or RNA helicase